MDQFWSISLVLERVVKERIAQTNHALPIVLVDVVFELLVPHPVSGLPGLIFDELFNDINVMNDIKDERLDLAEKKVVSFVIEHRITF